MAEQEIKTENQEPAEGQKKFQPGKITCKVSEKGAVSVYGLGRFPVTLYKEQWNRLLGEAEQIRKFIEANDHLLKKKEQAQAQGQE